MFLKPHGVLFALSGLFVSELVLGFPVQPEVTNEPLRRVVRVVARDVFASSCSACATAITVKVSGAGTAIPTASAVTVSVGSATSTSTASPSTIGNFGSCSVPQIEFGAGFDGRNETAFQPVDKVSYNHDSADSIDPIAEFICNALVTTCNADTTAQATCVKAQAAATAATPFEGIDADAFNAVFGIQTNFKNVEAISDTGVPIAGSTSNNAPNGAASTANSTASSIDGPQQSNATAGQASSVIVSTSTTDAAATTTAAVTDKLTIVTTAAATSKLTTETALLPPAPLAPLAPPASTASTTTTSANLQLFTGALGGVTAPAVVATGAQFQVEGNSIFNTKIDALTRSCDVQQNNCADAANASGDKGALTVDACGTQRTACTAASGT